VRSPTFAPRFVDLGHARAISSVLLGVIVAMIIIFSGRMTFTHG
jgi:hypothetical protein